MSRRAPFQVLILPFRRRADESIEYGVLRRSDRGVWQGFAGGGHVGETPAVAARREAREEGAVPHEAPLYELDARATVPTHHFAAALQWGPDVFVIPEYAFAIDCSGQRVALSPEHTEIRWLELDAARALLR